MGQILEKVEALKDNHIETKKSIDDIWKQTNLNSQGIEGIKGYIEGIKK